MYSNDFKTFYQLNYLYFGGLLQYPIIQAPKFENLTRSIVSIGSLSTIAEKALTKTYYCFTCLVNIQFFQMLRYCNCVCMCLLVCRCFFLQTGVMNQKKLLVNIKIIVKGVDNLKET